MSNDHGAEADGGAEPAGGSMERAVDTASSAGEESERVSRPRGSHAGLSSEAIVFTAIRIADREGLPALSMRRIGTELGVEAMALYHHFPNKAALLDAIVEEIATSAAALDFSGSTWRDGVKGYARGQLRALLRHPNLVELVMYRPAVTARNLALLEGLVEVLCAAGFSPRRGLDMVYAINEFVLMHAGLSAGFGSVAAPHGERGQDSRLSEISEGTYPRLVEAAREGRDRGPDARFEFTLDVLVAGFAEVRSRESD